MIKRKKRGQISIDFIIAVLFLTLVSILIYYNIFSFTDGTTDALIVDKMYSIADTFENYAILAYTKNKTITFKLKPMGTIGYNITILNKTISVYGDTSIMFIPKENGVIITGFLNSPKNVGNNIVITANVYGNIINISKKLEINVSFI
ncbi:hypothetical protein JH146_1520 [Methanocaldococcus bathoardescens]|uniref:Flagellin n=1 Tax=Methanocaldococcus bathoardescens TaxID=1301915 RepID=A0A076LHF9_9EURY|nr:hypothetical protein [Methanocaldococcus bathoardescens]AIJ06362.1 hypothetical protein JH146_1520 [Methanocaldococcus bathoardescens]